MSASSLPDPTVADPVQTTLASLPLSRYSSQLKQTATQTAWAMAWLAEAPTDLPPAAHVALLAAAAALFFNMRDQLAYETMAQKGWIAHWGLSVRHLPTLNQLIALINSKQSAADSPHTVACLACLKELDESLLGVPNFRTFRDRLIQHGVTTQPLDTNTPFPSDPMDLAPVRQEALSGWQRLCSWMQHAAEIPAP
jgi:hypothetical protein